MDGNSWKGLEIAWNGLKWLGIDGNGWKWLEMAVFLISSNIFWWFVGTLDIWALHDFHWLGPLGRVSLVLAMYMCLWCCLMSSPHAFFFQASHWPWDHMISFQASYWGLLGDVLGNSWALLGDFLGTSWGLLGHFLSTSWALLGHFFNRDAHSLLLESA